MQRCGSISHGSLGASVPLVQEWQSVSLEPEFLYKSVEPAQIEKILPKAEQFSLLHERDARAYIHLRHGDCDGRGAAIVLVGGIEGVGGGLAGGDRHTCATHRADLRRNDDVRSVADAP